MPFGHPHNDPVSVILGLAVDDVGRARRVVADLANVFNDAAVDPGAGAAADDAIRTTRSVG